MWFERQAEPRVASLFDQRTPASPVCRELVVSGADRDLVFQDSELVARRASPYGFIFANAAVRLLVFAKRYVSLRKTTSAVFSPRSGRRAAPRPKGRPVISSSSLTGSAPLTFSRIFAFTTVSMFTSGESRAA